jgi:LCP family protein required for cell wall assembly
LQLLLSVVVLCALLVTTAGAALAAPQPPAAGMPQPYVEQAQQPSVAPPDKPSNAPAASPSLQKTTNILLLGSDRRPNTPNWRTDVMMIIAIDEATKQVGVISLPRDIYVDEIPNRRGNKINVIDYLGEQDEPGGGGPKLLGQILEKKIGVPIDHYIRFDFEAFKKLVDAMGGVEIEVDCPLYDPQGYDQGGLPLALDKGVHRLNGGQALSYVRSRLVGGDLERERRQQRFAWAVRSQILNENLLTRVPAMYQALNDHVQTDLGLRDAIKLVRFALDLDAENVHGFVVNDPSMIKEGYAGQMWVWYPNWANIAAAAKELFNTPPLLDTNTQDERCPG